MTAPGDPIRGASGHSTAARTVAELAGVAAAYFVAGKLGLFFASVNSLTTAVWPPTGIALAAMLYYGYRVWPAVLVAAFAVNASTSGAIIPSVFIAIGNTIEALVGTYLVNRYAGGIAAFDRARNIFRYALGAGGIATIIAATIGVTTLTLFDLVGTQPLGEVWITWWLGDAAGALIFAPLILLWVARPPSATVLARRNEAVLVFGSVIASGLMAFIALTDYPLAFLCLPALAWAAFRLSQREVITAVALLMVIAVLSLEMGRGPYAIRSPHESLLVLQAFVLTITLVTLPMSAVVADRERMLGEADTARRSAEDAAKTKDEFLALLSHELRNPLAAITAASGILRETVDGNKLAARAVEIVDRQTAHLGRLVDDLLDISRITRGKISLERRTVSLTDIATRAVEVCRPLHAARNQRFDFVEPRETLWVEGDVTRLAQVFTNLLSNAAKYTPNGGHIKLSIAREDGQAVVRVRDTGIGISDQLLPSIFDLFTQGDQSLERSEGGLGLGLAVAKRLVELSGGTISAHSEGPWRGSEFIVRLPMVATPPVERRDPAPMRMTYPSPVRKVLVVDDNVDSADSLAVLLRMRGNDVRVEHDGPAAVAAADEYQPNVGLVDIGLPGMSGYEVAKEIRRKHGKDMVLIAVTGYGQDDDRRRSREAGFDEHLTKPVQFEVLEKHLAALTASRGG